MPDLFISAQQAESDLLACAAFIGERIKSGTGHAEAMKSVLPHYLARGDVDLAAELANAVEDPFSRDKLLVAIAAKCAELDDDDYALQLADAIEDQGMQADALEKIGILKARQGDTDKAGEIASRMAHPDEVLAAIAAQQSASGNAAAAEQTLASIEFGAARVSALHTIARQHLEQKENDLAAATLAKALDAANDIEHDEERIRALCDTGTLFAEAGDPPRSVDAFTQAREDTEALESFHRDYFFVDCALGFLYAGDEARADEALDLVTDKTQMSSALVGFAREYWEKDRKQDALDTIDEAYEILRSQREIETRDSRARNTLMASIAAQFASFEKADRAMQICLENPSDSDKVAALTQVAQVLTLQRNDHLARQTIELMDEDADRLFALIGIADAKQKIGDEQGMKNFLDEAAQLADSVPQLAARSNVLNAIAARLASLGEQDKARVLALENLQVISDIRDESSQSAAMANLAEVYGMAGLEIGDAERPILESLVRQVERSA